MAEIRVPRPRRRRGLTLVESAVTLALAAVVVGLAVPGFAAIGEHERLRAVASALQTDIAFARSQAAAQSRTLRLEFAGPRCWLLHDGPAGCGCGPGAAACPGRLVLRQADLGAGHPVELRANVGSILFEPTRGTVTPTTTVRLSLPQGPRLHLVVNLMGRVRRCSPDGLPGEAAC